MKHGLWIAPLALLASCDKAKAFIDPSGTAYDKPTDQSTAPAANPPSSATPATTTPPASQPAQAPTDAKFDATVRMPAIGRNLTSAEALRQISGIEFQDGTCTWMFKNGVGRCGSSLASLVDSAGKPWGLTVGDLDLDGSDDAVVLVRFDRAGSDPRW